MASDERDSSTHALWTDTHVVRIQKGSSGTVESHDLNGKERDAEIAKSDASKPADAATPAPAFSDRGVDVTEVVQLSSFEPGEKVRYWSKGSGRWVDAIVECSKHIDGVLVYDLDCKKGTSAANIMRRQTTPQVSYILGEDVEYWSAKVSSWLPCKIIAMHNDNGQEQCDLSIKHGALLSSLRKAVATPAGSSSSATPRFKQNETVEYWSDSQKSWINGEVKAVKNANGEAVYDLDIKKNVRESKMQTHIVEVNDAVEYWSSSSSTWRRAKVLRVDIERGQCDLDAKAQVPLASVRRKVVAKIAVTEPETPVLKTSVQVAGITKAAAIASNPVVEPKRPREDDLVVSPKRPREDDLALSPKRPRDDDLVADATEEKRRAVDSIASTALASTARAKSGASTARAKSGASSASTAVAVSESQSKQMQEKKRAVTLVADAREEKRRAVDGSSGVSSASTAVAVSDVIGASSATANGEDSLAIMGIWRGNGKMMQIRENGGGLIVDMGPQAPTLRLIPVAGEKGEAWPRSWAAVRNENSDLKNALYIAELPEKGSRTLLMKRPIGDGVVPFERCSPVEEPLPTTDASPALLQPSLIEVDLSTNVSTPKHAWQPSNDTLVPRDRPAEINVVPPEIVASAIQSKSAPSKPPVAIGSDGTLVPRDRPAEIKVVPPEIVTSATQSKSAPSKPPVAIGAADVAIGAADSGKSASAKPPVIFDADNPTQSKSAPSKPPVAIGSDNVSVAAPLGAAAPLQSSEVIVVSVPPPPPAPPATINAFVTPAPPPAPPATTGNTLAPPAAPPATTGNTPPPPPAPPQRGKERNQGASTTSKFDCNDDSPDFYDLHNQNAGRSNAGSI